MSMLTPSEILLDALIHGFVQMAKLSLLVFDEGKLEHLCSRASNLLVIQRSLPLRFRLIVSLSNNSKLNTQI